MVHDIGTLYYYDAYYYDLYGKIDKNFLLRNDHMAQNTHVETHTVSVYSEINTIKQHNVV